MVNFIACFKVWRLSQSRTFAGAASHKESERERELSKSRVSECRPTASAHVIGHYLKEGSWWGWTLQDSVWTKMWVWDEWIMRSKWEALLLIYNRIKAASSVHYSFIYFYLLNSYVWDQPIHRLASQIECFTYPWNIFLASIRGTAHTQHLERANKLEKYTWEVTVWTFCLSHSLPSDHLKICCY